MAGRDRLRGIGGWCVCLVVGISALVAGCSRQQEPAPASSGAAAGKVPNWPEKPPLEKSSSKEPGKEPTTAQSQAPASPNPTAAPAPPPSIPKVYLTEEQRKNSHVGVGDLLPDAALPDLSGKPLSIRGQFGKRLTVLVLFHAGGMVDNMRSKELLQDLDRDVIAAHGKKGVAVIAVDVQDPPEKVKSLVQEAQVGFPVLLDAEGAYFAKLAAGALPRIYALDPVGKVLWFDLEYSNTTRSSLKQTILSVLGESPQGF
jgi:peroxiredoxin